MAEKKSTYIRLKRAADHQQALNARFDEWFIAGRACRAIEDMDPDTGEQVVHVELTEPTMFIEAGTRIGEILYLFRSTLDHFAYALAEAESGPLTMKQAAAVEFPIFGDREMTTAERKRKIGLMSPKAQLAIEGLQPYKRGKSFLTHPLWVLNELRRMDHHRSAIEIHMSGAVELLNPRGAFKSLEVRDVRINEVGRTEILRYRPQGHVQMNAEVAVGITVGPGLPREGESVLKVLTEIGVFIDHTVLPRLIRLIPAGNRHTVPAHDAFL